jgi:hypothetical protein
MAEIMRSPTLIIIRLCVLIQHFLVSLHSAETYDHPETARSVIPPGFYS